MHHEAEDIPGWREEFSSERARGTALTIVIPYAVVTALCGELNLALRHPENRGPSSRVTLNFVEGLVARLAEDGFPALAAGAGRDLEDTLRIRKAFGAQGRQSKTQMANGEWRM